jgi:hypothetical protein
VVTPLHRWYIISSINLPCPSKRGWDISICQDSKAACTLQDLSNGSDALFWTRFIDRNCLLVLSIPTILMEETTGHYEPGVCRVLFESFIYECVKHMVDLAEASDEIEL